MSMIQLKNSRRAENDLHPATYRALCDQLIEEAANSPREYSFAAITTKKGELIARRHAPDHFSVTYYRYPLTTRAAAAIAKIVKAAAEKIAAAASSFIY